VLIGVDASRAARPRRTGTEHYSLCLIRSLVALPGRHRYRLYTNGPPPPEAFPRSPRVEIRSLPSPRLWTHLRLSWEVARRPPDVVFVPAHVLPVISPGRAVVTVHDLGYLRHPQAHAPFSRWYLDRLTRRSVALAAEVIAVSAATRDDLVRFYGAAPDRIAVVHHGLDHDRFRPIEDPGALEETRRRYGIDSPYLLHVGTIHPRKNLTVILRALADLRARGLDVCLALAGGLGWRAEEVIARGGEGVRWLGYVAEGDLPALMSGARALVMPSLYEGFGMPVLEAMACGIPVVCSRASSLPEVAGDAALLVDPQDDQAWVCTLSRVLRDEDLRASLVSRGLKRAARFTWERCAQETLAVLERAGGRGA